MPTPTKAEGQHSVSARQKEWYLSAEEYLKQAAAVGLAAPDTAKKDLRDSKRLLKKAPSQQPPDFLRNHFRDSDTSLETFGYKATQHPEDAVDDRPVPTDEYLEGLAAEVKHMFRQITLEAEGSKHAWHLDSKLDSRDRRRYNAAGARDKGDLYSKPDLITAPVHTHNLWNMILDMQKDIKYNDMEWIEDKEQYDMPWRPQVLKNLGAAPGQTDEQRAKEREEEERWLNDLKQATAQFQEERSGLLPTKDPSQADAANFLDDLLTMAQPIRSSVKREGGDQDRVKFSTIDAVQPVSEEEESLEFQARNSIKSTISKMTLTMSTGVLSLFPGSISRMFGKKGGGMTSSATSSTIGSSKSKSKKK